MRKFTKKYSLFIYFILSYIITWAITFPISFNLLPLQWHFIGAIGPLLSAVITSYFSGYLKVFWLSLHRLIKAKSIALCLSPFILAALSLIFSYFKGKSPTFDLNDFQLTILPILTYGILEEVGWRGFALPRLQQKYQPLIATFILTIFWTVWHLPMFGYRLKFDSPLMFFGFFLSILFGSILLTSLYNLSGRSVISVALFHMANNLISVAKETVFISTYSILLIILSTIIVITTRGNLFFSNNFKK